MISSTIKSSGGSFSTMQGWENAIAGTDDETGSCESNAALQTSKLTLSATGSFTYLLTAAAGYRPTATYASVTAKARIAVSGVVAIEFGSSQFIVDGIGIVVSSGTTPLGIIIDSGNASFTMRNVVFYTDNGVYTWYFSGSGTHTIINCASFGGVNGGNLIQSEGGTTNVYLSSFNSAGNLHKGISRDGGTLNCYGVVVQHGASINISDYSGTIGGDYNVSEDTSAPGSNSVKSVSTVYTNGSNTTEDLTLTSGSWKGIVNRSGWPSDTGNDLVGTARPSSGADPGCLQTASSSSPISGSATFSFTPAATIRAKGALAGSQTVSFTPAATIRAKGALAGSQTFSFTPTGTGRLMGRVSGSATFQFSPSATIRAKGALVASMTFTFSPSATIRAAGGLAGSATLSFSPTGTITAHGTLAGSGTVSFAPAATIRAKGTLSGSSTFQFTATCSNTPGAIAGSTSVSFTATGTLRAKGALAAAMIFSFAPAATIRAKGSLSGLTLVTFSPAGGVVGKTSLSGSTQITFTPSAAILAKRMASGSASVSFSASATLTLKTSLVGSSVLSFSAAAEARGRGALSGSCTFTFTATALPLVDYQVIEAIILEDGPAHVLLEDLDYVLIDGEL